MDSGSSWEEMKNMISVIFFSEHNTSAENVSIDGHVQPMKSCYSEEFTRVIFALYFTHSWFHLKEILF